MPQWFLVLSAGLFGLLFGSFANVVIWRFPRGESVATPGSHCPSCDTPIAWYDNIPVASWLVLRARCQSCGAPISARYPIVEALSGALWALAAAQWGLSWTTLFGIVFFYGLLVLSGIDIDHFRLPNALVAALGVVGVVGVALASFGRVRALPLVGIGAYSSALLSAALGLFIGAGLPLLVAAIYSAIRRRRGLGMGDVKLLGVMGLYLGPYVLGALMIGSLVGAVYGMVAVRGEGVLAKKIPFGPFLAVGAVVTALVGEQLWTAYLRVAGIA